MFEYHKDKKRYFDIQYRTAKDHILPFLGELFETGTPKKVLEIGCAEAGVLKAFTELGHSCVGIELNPKRIELAEVFMKDELASGKIRFIAKNIYDIDVAQDIGHAFDLVILKDVIEHIHDQERFMKELHQFLNPGGMVFFGFPPWQMPFGGHQQVARNKFLSVLPYYHLLPRPLYKMILKAFGESPSNVEGLLEIKDTGISIERFERIVKRSGYSMLKRKLFLFNPIYEFKFGLKAREQFRILSAIPYFRNYCTTCAYYVIN